MAAKSLVIVVPISLQVTQALLGSSGELAQPILGGSGELLKNFVLKNFVLGACQFSSTLLSKQAVSIPEKVIFSCLGIYLLPYYPYGLGLSEFNQALNYHLKIPHFL